jgi:hypothetical protein
MTDGAPGLIKAVCAIWPEAERIRCWAHKMRNVLDKVPDKARSGLRPYLEAIRDALDHPCPMGPGRVRQQLSFDHEELGRRPSGQPGSPRSSQIERYRQDRQAEQKDEQPRNIAVVA